MNLSANKMFKMQSENALVPLMSKLSLQPKRKPSKLLKKGMKVVVSNISKISMMDMEPELKWHRYNGIVIREIHEKWNILNLSNIDGLTNVPKQNVFNEKPKRSKAYKLRKLLSKTNFAARWKQLLVDKLKGRHLVTSVCVAAAPKSRDVKIQRLMQILPHASNDVKLTRDESVEEFFLASSEYSADWVAKIEKYCPHMIEIIEESSRLRRLGHAHPKISIF